MEGTSTFNALRALSARPTAGTFTSAMEGRETSKGAAEEVAKIAETAVRPKLLKRMLMVGLHNNYIIIIKMVTE